jgi:hypothetical protein
MADSLGTLIHLDIDYANPSDPREPFEQPRRVFARLEPVFASALERLSRYGLRPLSLMTARGYHLVLRARRGSSFHAALLAIGALGPSRRLRYERLEAELPGAVEMGLAHEGAGRLLEHLAHEVLRGLRGHTRLPVTLADVPPPGRGPFACIDLSAYADPLFSRHLRCAFSSNQKAWMRGLSGRRPFVVAVPRRQLPVARLWRTNADLAAAARLATHESGTIPDAPARGLAWVEAYRRSPLHEFHRAFDRGPQVPRIFWPYSYDALRLGALPGCVRVPLEQPNPALLVPARLRTVALALWGLGWHPRSVAGLVRSRFEADHGWGDYWVRYDAAARAEFYVRLFCGAAACGLDEADSFTCLSQALRGVCSEQHCGHDLARLFPARRVPAASARPRHAG